MGTTFQAFLEGVLRSTSQPRLYGSIPSDHILGEELVAAPIEPNQGYMQVRVSEIFLRDERSLWVNFVPLELAVSEFYYAHKKQCVPCFIGNRLLGDLESLLNGSAASFRNTPVTALVPYLGGGYSLFVGLFRVASSDMVEGLFRFVEPLLKTFDVGLLSKYLDMARSVNEGLTGLLGLKGITPRLAIRDSFTDEPGDPQRLTPGYLVYVNCPETELPRQTLWVQDGRLRVGSGPGQLAPFAAHDYTLVRIGAQPQRDDYRRMDFYARYEEVAQLLFENPDKARWKRIELAQGVAACPDLIDDDKARLIQLFETHFAKLSGQGPKPGSVSRGGDRLPAPASSSDPAKWLKRVAVRAEEAGRPADVVRNLLELSANWQKIPELPSKGTAQLPDAATINRQLTALSQVQGSKLAAPEALAEAVALSCLA